MTTLSEKVTVADECTFYDFMGVHQKGIVVHMFSFGTGIYCVIQPSYPGNSDLIVRADDCVWPKGPDFDFGAGFGSMCDETRSASDR